MTPPKNFFRSIVLPLAVILVGGLLALGLCYLLFAFIYNFVELRFFPTAPTYLPANLLRRIYVGVLLVLWVALQRTQSPALLKATILVGPLGLATATAILAFYQTPTLAIVAIVSITAICTALLIRFKQPWFYTLAVAVAIFTATVLAWSPAA